MMKNKSNTIFSKILVFLSSRIIFCVLAFLCFAFVSCASSSFIVPESAYVPNDFFGITPERMPLNTETFELLDELNAVWIRDTIRWTSVEHGEGNWNFSEWDDLINTVEAAGKKLVLVLGFDNGWLYENGKEHRNMGERELSFFLKYVEQVVCRYQTRVVYEIWNEPNFVYWDGSDKKFFALVKATAEKIRELVPDATILAGATFRVPSGYIRKLFKSGAMEHTDGISIHPYGLTPAGTMNLIDKLLKIFDDFNYKKPIWITEVGYSTGSVFIGNRKRHAELVVKNLSGIAARSSYVRNMIWYELIDEVNPGDKQNYLDFLNYCGLMYPNGTYKSGTEAFMLTANYLAGKKYIPIYPVRENISHSITSLYFRSNDGSSVLILWKNGLGKRKMTLTIPGAENVTRHNINNREETLLPENITLEINREPVFITWTDGSPPRLTKK